MSAIIEQKCDCCGGAVEFNPATGKLKCPYCDTEKDIVNTPSASENEAHEDGWSAKGNEWAEGEADGVCIYTCNSCGGEIVAEKVTGAASCPYCGNQIVVKGQFSGMLKPDIIIPFKLDKKAAKAALKKHITSKRFVPKAFVSENRLDDIKGIYVPYWLYTCDTSVAAGFSAQKVRRWSDDENNYTETSYFNVHRSGFISFDNIPVDGSAKMPDDLMESIEPFDLSGAEEFNMAYLAGYLADKYDTDADAGIPRVNERIKQSAEDAFKETVKGYDRVDTENVGVNILNGTYKYALCPVWLLNTSWKGEKFTFAMNGQTGKFVGNIPTDKKAVTIASLLLGSGLSTVIYGLLRIWLMLQGG